MTNSAPVLGLITARGGSRTLPGKNLRRLHGRSLIEWTVRAAQHARCIDRLVISTDADDIAQEARRVGCEVPFMRPAELATDEASSVDVVLHALQELGLSAGHVVLLQPTSPLRTAADIDACFDIYRANGARAATSVCESPVPPTWMYTIGDGNLMQPVIAERPAQTRRQEQPACYVCNGAVYVVGVEWFATNRQFVTKETAAYVMPPERSVDIDTEHDFRYAEWLLADEEGRQSR